jgi:NAD(P)-dependent dehydrogenase (short-subunit alcohol dehydrogenase family)
MTALLAGRKAAITGAASGIGQAVALSFAAEGARLALIDQSADGLDRLVAELASTPGAEPPLSVLCDVRSGAAVTAAFADIRSALGGVDILVCCAGIREIADALTITHEQFEQTIAVDLCGTFYCCQAAALAMSEAGGGAIINVASVTGLIGESERPAYTAAKHGVLGLTKSLACDLARHSIRVNAICPGLIRTPLTEGYFGDESFAAALQQSIPLGTYGQPRHVADAAVFLASAKAEYITGISLPVDGGFLAEKAFAVGPAAAAYLSTPDRRSGGDAALDHVPR